MKINDIDLDSLDRHEYMALIQTLIDYFYVSFSEDYLELIKGSDSNE